MTNQFIYKIDIRLNSVLIVLAVLFFCIFFPIETKLTHELNNITRIETNKSFNSHSSDGLSFLPNFPNRLLSYETAGNFSIIQKLFLYKISFSCFGLFMQDIFLDIHIINVLWYKLSDGKK